MRGFAIIFLLSLLQLISGSNFAYDETVWTKKGWDTLKLHFPAHKLLKQMHLEDLGLTSDSGPFLMSYYENSKNQASSLDSEISFELEEDMVKPAAAIVGCKVCHTLVTVAWRGLSKWMRLEKSQPSAPQIFQYLVDTCDSSIVQLILKDWVVRQWTKDDSAPHLEELHIDRLVLRKRDGEVINMHEMTAVRRACTELIKGPDPATLPSESPLAQGFSAALTEFAAELKIDVKPAPELGPQVDGCLDLHPECAKWANAVRSLNFATW